VAALNFTAYNQDRKEKRFLKGLKEKKVTPGKDGV